MKLLTFSLLLTCGLNLHAEVELPSLSIFNYLRSARDPFISPKAPTTFLNERVEPTTVTSEELMSRFVEKVTLSIKDQLSVGGLSIDGEQKDAIALINGMAFHPGDTLPIEVNPKTSVELDQLAQSFGLTLQRTANKEIKIQVARISAAGVDFMLPGFNASICQLPVERNDTLNEVKLAPRNKQKKP
jgi:hypothetical protein